MLQFFLDAIDLALFRAKPLERYAYDWWVSVVWLTILSCMPVLVADELHASLLERLFFYLVQGWVATVLMSVFLAWWLRMASQLKPDASLFPLIVLASTTDLLQPLLGLIPGDDGQLALELLVIYQFAVLMHALTRSVGVSLGRALLGVVAFIPTALVLQILSNQVAYSAGWAERPVESQALPAEPAAALPSGDQ